MSKEDSKQIAPDDMRVRGILSGLLKSYTCRL